MNLGNRLADFVKEILDYSFSDLIRCWLENPDLSFMWKLSGWKMFSAANSPHVFRVCCLPLRPMVEEEHSCRHEYQVERHSNALSMCKQNPRPAQRLQCCSPPADTFCSRLSDGSPPCVLSCSLHGIWLRDGKLRSPSSTVCHCLRR